MSQIGIYKYTNVINGKIYIGQSTNIQKRYSQHLYDATKRPERGTGVDRAIAKYGIENFKFEIIEECSVEKLNERERYWINFYDSYHNGYNCSLGGNSLKGSEHPRSILNEEDVWIIRDLYQQHINRKTVYEMFKDKGISERGFKKVWDNENCGHSEDQIGLSSLERALTQEEINLMYRDYQSGLNVYQISKKYNRDCGIVSKYMNNPIANQEVKYTGRAVKNLNTGLIFSSISKAAKWAKCGATTLTRHLYTDKIAGKVPDTGEPAQWIEIS